MENHKGELIMENHKGKVDYNTFAELAKGRRVLVRVENTEGYLVETTLKDIKNLWEFITGNDLSQEMYMMTLSNPSDIVFEGEE